VGVTEVEDQIWLVSFLDYDLGYFDNERGRVEPGPNPFAPDKVLTMCPEYTFLNLAPRGGLEPPTK
jgi:putative transposase